MQWEVFRYDGEKLGEVDAVSPTRAFMAARRRWRTITDFNVAMLDPRRYGVYTITYEVRAPGAIGNYRPETQAIAADSASDALTIFRQRNAEFVDFGSLVSVEFTTSL